MSAAVPLAVRIAKNRQLKLLAAQSRHLAARFSDIFGDASVRTTRLNDRHFESTVFYPFSGLCTLRLASEIAESLSEAVERVRGAALALFYSKADLRHMLQAVDSDVFAELNATLDSMDAKAVIHLARAKKEMLDATASQFMVTVTAQLPLKDEEITEVGESGGKEYNIMTDIAICRSTGQCPRDAIKRGFALTLAELDEYAVEEQRSREEEAWCYLQSVQRDELQRDWDSVALSVFLSRSLGDGNLNTIEWLPPREETDTVRVACFSRKESRSLTLTIRDAAGNETLLTLPLHSPPLAFQRVLVGDDDCSARIVHTSALAWPEKWIVSSALMQLCTILNADVRDPEKVSCGTAGVALTSQRISFLSVRSFAEAHGTLPVTAVPYSIERCLFMVNNRVALCFAKKCGREYFGGSSMPLICLGVVSKETKKLGQGIHLQLEVEPSEGGAECQKYRNFVTTLLRRANKEALRGRHETKLQKATAITAGLLGHLWRLFFVIAGLAEKEGMNPLRDISVWSPSEILFSGNQQEKQQELSSLLCQLFAVDAQVVEKPSWGGSFPNILHLSSSSLGVQALPVCHTLETPEMTLKRLLDDASPSMAEVVESASKTDPRRTVEVAAQQREIEQSSYYCPDILLMIQEMRLELHMPQRSFPTLEFFQKAVHDVPQRVQEIAMGTYGDVPVYTRVVAHWGPNLRVEVESDMMGLTDNYGVYRFDSPHHNHCGPLGLLLSVVYTMYERVFPHRRTVPLIGLNSPNRRRSIDFLLYSWFMASPQIRCFEISTRAARLAAATTAMAKKSSDVAEMTLSHSVGNYIIRAMLFYDFCGQRVLFAETHAPTLWEAVRRVNELAVSLNIPKQDFFPTRATTRRDSRSFYTPPDGCDSEVAFLLRALMSATRSQLRVCFVSTNDSTALWIEGTIELQVPIRQIRCAVSVTRTRGVVPALVLACREALRCTSDEEEAERLLRSAHDAGPLIPRDNFPRFSSRFYTPVNLLGEVLQGVAGKYHCTYTIDSKTREVVCLLHVPAMAGYGNAARDSVPFPLGIGRGRSKKVAWAAAASQALQANFPDVLPQVERHKKLCELLHRPDDLSRLGCPEGFKIEVVPDREKESGGGYKCTVISRQPSNVSDVNTTAEVSDVEHPKILFEYSADRSVDAYLAAADALLDRLQQQRQERTAAQMGDSVFHLWDFTSNYGKSVWHACCGALGVAFGGKVSLRFEGGREDASVWESEVPMRVQLVVRTWSPADERVIETPLHMLNERRIVGYGSLTGLYENGKPSAEQLIFASTHLLAEAIIRYTDEHTRKCLQRLLNLFQQLKEGEKSCSRLNAKRRVESYMELTLGCQCRVVVRQVACGMVRAELGAWLPGHFRESRVPVVLSACTENTTGKALSGLEESVRQFVESLWAIVRRSCAC
ncbi:hypothetical protein TcBrA4_0136100 [Trypanosoma cruzi]|nr:hypothetical protein TcBrA4_0136100 [Trypanosoma cruzi]